MGVVRIEIIERPVNISRHEHNGVKSVLLPIRLGEHDAHGFGQRIRRAARMRRAVEQFAFPDRIGRLIGVTACAHQGHVFLHAGPPAFVKHHRAHDEVFITEFRRVFLVRQHAPDSRGQVEDQIRPLLVEQAADLTLFTQITVAAGKRYQFAIGSLQQRNQIGSDKAASPGHEHFSSSPIIGGRRGHWILCHNIRRRRPARGDSTPGTVGCAAGNAPGHAWRNPPPDRRK